MIIPSIALQAGPSSGSAPGSSGRAVALGPGFADLGDAVALARQLAVAGELAVTDLDASRQQGHNRALLEELLAVAPTRVGGGIRDMGTAEYWLDKGATRIVLGTAATPHFLRQLPRGRVLVALDVGDGGEVVVDGRTRGTGQHVLTQAAALRDLAAGFVLTFIGRTEGVAEADLALALEVARLVGSGSSSGASVTVAVDTARADEVGRLDSLGLDLQVGSGLTCAPVGPLGTRFVGVVGPAGTRGADAVGPAGTRFVGVVGPAGTRGAGDSWVRLADAIVAPVVRGGADELIPTVVCDEHGVALGLCHSNLASVREAVRLRRGVYADRAGGLLTHGEGRDNWQELQRVELDRARETLRFTVRQHGGGFGDGSAWTAWGSAVGLPALARRLMDRVGFAPVGSYTRRLLDDPKLLRAKLIEEARELAQARGADEIVWEAADVFYFTMVSLARAGVPLADVGLELDRRARKIVRRKGEAKAVPPPGFLEDPPVSEEP